MEQQNEQLNTIKKHVQEQFLMTQIAFDEFFDKKELDKANQELGKMKAINEMLFYLFNLQYGNSK